MILITKKPVTPSQRNLIKLNNKHLNKQPILKKNIKGLKNSNGRNNSGKITIRHKGNGHKKKYRIINFNRISKSIGITISIEYDPNRNSNVAVIFDLNQKNFFYILAPKDLTIGDLVKSGTSNEPKIGYSMPLLNIPIGSFIHSISSKKSKPAQISRSAGTFSILKEKTLNYVKIKLSSGEIKLISPGCYATIGVVSNEFAFLTRLGKAGQSRWLNRRPTVRGVAMNPIDHPHGGGEGKKSGSHKTPWGKALQKRKNKLIINKK